MGQRALVIGGGIGGLASAIALSRAGWDVAVHERAPELPASGTALGIWPEAVHALDRLGLGEELRRSGRPQAPGVLRRQDGTRVATLDTGKLERRTGEPVYLVSRPALLGLLYAVLPAGTVRFSTKVTDPAALAEEHDVLVGADGINSRVRGTMFGPGFAARYSGVVTWRGVVDLEVESGGETWAPGRKFGFTPLESGRTNWYGTLRTAEGHEPADGDLAELARLFGTWHDPIPRIVREIKPDDVLRHSLHHLDPPLPSFVRDNVALLGDAAHAMPPDLGQGACQALIDGLVLGECLVDSANVGVALAEYDRLRRRRSQRVAAMARRVSAISYAKRCTGLRDLAVRAALAVTTPGG
jgi:2-polyprenyl-6-methoxyphenol hydroxylase-like FAD-dependent oxidoreductase